VKRFTQRAQRKNGEKPEKNLRKRRTFTAEAERARRKKERSIVPLPSPRISGQAG
jgi:hypothetical protein